ncbi:unnamed protein product [Bathycoccus prasinos]
MSSRSFRKKTGWGVVVLGTIFLSFVLRRYTQVSRGLLESKADLEIKGDLEIVIVYNVYLPTRRDWRPLLRSQMQDIADIGLLERSELHVSISAEINETTDSKTSYLDQKLQFQEAIQIIDKITSKRAKYELTLGNFYEYPGIARLWRLGRLKDRQSLFLYFHSKGMVNHGNSLIANKKYKPLFLTVIKPWQEVKRRFKENRKLNLAGYAASRSGFIWYNFFWVRGSYLKTLTRPIKTSRRHYYEDYISRVRGPGDIEFSSSIQLNFDFLPRRFLRLLAICLELNKLGFQSFQKSFLIL